MKNWSILCQMYSNPITLAHRYWQLLLSPSDQVIDATCGNGKDTLQLAKLVPDGLVIGIDIQPQAISNTLKMTEKEHNVLLFHQSHAHFPEIARPNTLQLIVYNLGYLPGSQDKTLTTLTDSTLISIKNSFNLLKAGGALSIMCYPGHTEGQKEETALFALFSALSTREWDVCHHRWVNRALSPSLFIVQKKFI